MPIVKWPIIGHLYLKGVRKQIVQIHSSVLLFAIDRRYYRKQDELISAYEGIHLDNSKLDSESTRIRLRRQATRLAKISFFMNFVSHSCSFGIFSFVCTICTFPTVVAIARQPLCSTLL